MATSLFLGQLLWGLDGDKPVRTGNRPNTPAEFGQAGVFKSGLQGFGHGGDVVGTVSRNGGAWSRNGPDRPAGPGRMLRSKFSYSGIVQDGEEVVGAARNCWKGLR